MKIKSLQSLLIALFAVAFLASCSDSSTGSDEPEPEVEANTIEDLDATGEGGHYTFFSLRTGEIVDVADSASTNWDLAFNGTTVRTNSGVSGPGESGAIILDMPFNGVEIAPADGYRTDTEEELAIPTGGGNGWYSYDFNTHIIAPLDDKTIVVRTADGNHYAKVQIEHYYLGSPDMADDEFVNDPSGRDPGYYTFRYVIQLLEGERDLN